MRELWCNDFFAWDVNEMRFAMQILIVRNVLWIKKLRMNFDDEFCHTFTTQKHQASSERTNLSLKDQRPSSHSAKTKRCGWQTNERKKNDSLPGEGGYDGEIGATQLLQFRREIYRFFHWFSGVTRDGPWFGILFIFMNDSEFTTDFVTLDFCVPSSLTSHGVRLRHAASVCYFFPLTCGVRGVPWSCCCCRY